MNKSTVKKQIINLVKTKLIPLGFKKEEFYYVYSDSFKKITYYPDVIEQNNFDIDFFVSLYVESVTQLLNQWNDDPSFKYGRIYTFRYVKLIGLGLLDRSARSITSEEELASKTELMIDFFVNQLYPQLKQINSLESLYELLKETVYEARSKTYWQGTPEALILLTQAIRPEDFNTVLDKIYSHYPFLQVNSNFTKIIWKIRSHEFSEGLLFSKTLPEPNETSVQSIELKTASNIENVSTLVSGFDTSGEPDICTNEDGSVSVMFNFMPPLNGTNEGTDDPIFETFDEVISMAINCEVIWEDREHFLIPNPETDTIQRLIHFLNNFWRNHSKYEA